MFLHSRLGIDNVDFVADGVRQTCPTRAESPPRLSRTDLHEMKHDVHGNRSKGSLSLF